MIRNVIRKIICMAVLVSMIVGLIPLFAMSVKAADTTYVVTNWTELKNALEAEGKAKIQLAKDIKESSETDFTTVEVSGKKELDICGYSIEFNYNCNKKDAQMITGNRENMFSIPEGSELKLDDSVGGGVIQFNAHMLDPYDYRLAAIRDVFTVSGKMTIDNKLSHFKIKLTIKCDGDVIGTRTYDARDIKKNSVKVLTLKLENSKKGYDLRNGKVTVSYKVLKASK